MCGESRGLGGGGHAGIWLTVMLLSIVTPTSVVPSCTGKACEVAIYMLYVQYVMNFDFILDFDKLVMHIYYTEIIGNSHILDVHESLHHYSTQSMI